MWRLESGEDGGCRGELTNHEGFLLDLAAAGDLHLGRRHAVIRRRRKRAPPALSRLPRVSVAARCTLDRYRF